MSQSVLGRSAYQCELDEGTQITFYTWRTSNINTANPLQDVPEAWRIEDRAIEPHRYAPTEEDARYVKIASTSGRTLFNLPGRGDIYISVFLLAVLCCGGGDFWDDLSNNDEMDINQRLNIETEFIQSSGKVTDLKIVLGKGLPVRDKVGSLGWVTFRNVNEKEVVKFIGTVFKHYYHKSGKPSRFVDVPLQYPLKIVPLFASNEVIGKRFADGSSRQFFEWAIGEIKGQKKKKTHSWELEVYELDGLFDADKLANDGMVFGTEHYILLSVHPFNLYATFIHSTDWNNYMRSLGTELSVIRKFPAGKPTKKMDDLLSYVGSHDVITEQEKYYDGQVTDESIPGHRVSVKNMDKRADFFAIQDQIYVWGIPETTVAVQLDAKKIADACGKRGGEQSQKTVMGNTSATEVAQAWGWQDASNKLPGTSLSAAEWLHLSAFSWGGLGEAGSFATSQNIENLVFGTSEANSIMTRYEMAWQELFKAEQDLYDDAREYDKSLVERARGGLQIICNNPEDYVQYDHYDNDNGTYQVRSFKMSEAALEQLEYKPPAIAVKPEGRTIFGEEASKSDLEQWIMLGLSYWHRYVAYSINYTVGINTHSYLLGAPSYQCTTRFYPFRRGFFHSAEAALDNVIFQWLKAKGEEEMLSAKRLGEEVDDEVKVPRMKSKIWKQGGTFENIKNGRKTKKKTKKTN